MSLSKIVDEVQPINHLLTEYNVYIDLAPCIAYIVVSYLPLSI